MLVLGIDVAIMGMIAILCGIVCFLLCIVSGVSSETGNAVLVATMTTAIVMFCGYIAMSRILDAFIGYWW